MKWYYRGVGGQKETKVFCPFCSEDISSGDAGCRGVIPHGTSNNEAYCCDKCRLTILTPIIEVREYKDAYDLRSKVVERIVPAEVRYLNEYRRSYYGDEPGDSERA